jgi:predicted N-acyltransferase
VPLHIVITRSILETNLADWHKVCDPARDLLMHPGLLGAAEASMGVGMSDAHSHYADTHFWYLLAYSNDEPVGAACVTEYPLDTMVFADPWSQRFVAHVRRIFPRYLKFRVTFCGLPISIAGSNLRVVAGADTPAVVRALNDAIEQISRDRKTWLVIYKELDRHEAELAAPLESAGYVRADSLPMNRVSNEFGSFAAMLDAMRSHYRYKIARSRKKFAQSDLRLNRTTGWACIAELYTPELHSLYESVTCQSEHRLEILPREFFLELAARFPDEIVFATITHGTRVLAFAWSLRHAKIYRNLFVGIDYDHIGETDAYFNLMVEDLAYGVNQSVDEIFVGQSADDFKSRLGCTRDPRYLFIKVTNRFLQWCFLKFQSSFLVPPPTPPQRDVFKKEIATVNSVAKV